MQGSFGFSVFILLLAFPAFALRKIFPKMPIFERSDGKLYADVVIRMKDVKKIPDLFSDYQKNIFGIDEVKNQDSTSSIVRIYRFSQNSEAVAAYEKLRELENLESININFHG